MSISALFSTSINCFKTSTACRHAALIVLIGGLFLLLRPPADPRVMYWLGLLFFGMLGISLAVHTWRLWLNVRYPVFRKVVRALRSSRWILDVPPSVQLLHVMAFCAGFAALIFMQVTQSDTGFELPALVIGACLALAALIDLASRIARLVRQAWAPTAGKLFTVIIGAALLAIGVSIAKHVIHDITGANPANFSEFLAVFTALLVPVLYVLVSLCLLILLATCQFFWFVDFYGCAPNRGAVHPAGARADQSQAGRHLAQTQTWKKRRRPGASLFWGDLHKIARPASTIALALMLAWLVEAVPAHAKLFRTLATEGLVLMEYHEGSRCEGVGDDTLVAYIGDNNISTARLIDGTWTFKSIACHLPAGAKPALASTVASG